MWLRCLDCLSLFLASGSTADGQRGGRRRREGGGNEKKNKNNKDGRMLGGLRRARDAPGSGGRMLPWLLSSASVRVFLAQGQAGLSAGWWPCHSPTGMGSICTRPSPALPPCDRAPGVPMSRDVQLWLWVTAFGDGRASVSPRLNPLFPSPRFRAEQQPPDGHRLGPGGHQAQHAG